MNQVVQFQNYMVLNSTTFRFDVPLGSSESAPLLQTNCRNRLLPIVTHVVVLYRFSEQVLFLKEKQLPWIFFLSFS
jgi:hypothetical protein